MRKQFLFATLVLGLTGNTIAQVNNSDNKEIDEKRFEHYIGVQINPLLRQLLTIGTVPNTGNPFLLNYSMNNTGKHWGIHAGVGYNFDQVKDNDDITDRKTLISTVSSRIGIDKYFALSNRWQIGFGVDGVYELSENITSTQIISFDTITSENRITTQRSGGGIRGFARFKLSDRVLLGTESTMYYQFGFNKNEAKITSRDFNQPGAPMVTTSSSITQQIQQSRLALPVAVYLVFRF